MKRIENTRANKAKFFALYWGQKSVIMDGMHPSQTIRVNHVNLAFIDNCYLLLNPLSQISDEDAIEICKTAHPTSFLNTKLKWIVDTDQEYGFKTVSAKGSYHSFDIDTETGGVQIYDGDNPTSNTLNHFGVFREYVSKGYYVGDGTEVEYNWCKLRESQDLK